MSKEIIIYGKVFDPRFDPYDQGFLHLGHDALVALMTPEQKVIYDEIMNTPVEPEKKGLLYRIGNWLLGY